MSTKKFPVKDGWIHLKVGLKKGVRVTQRRLLQLLLPMGAKEEEYEVGQFKHGKKSATIIVRRKTDADATDQSNPE